MKRAWSVAWRNLRRNRRRNLATATAIALGYAGLVVLGGYVVRVERFLRTNAIYLQHSGHVAVWMRGGLQKATAEPERMQLDARTQAAIRSWAAQDRRVEFTSAYLRGMGLAGNGCATHPSSLLGVEPAILGKVIQHPEVQEWSPEMAAPAAGRWLDAYPNLKHPAAVAGGLAVLLKKPRVFDQAQGLPPAPALLDCDTPAEAEQLAADANVQLVSLTYDGILSAVDTEMVATFHAAESYQEDGSMVVPLTTLQMLFATDRVTYMGLFLHHPEDAAAVAKDLEAAIKAAGADVEALTYDSEEWNPYYVGSMAFLGSMVGFITMLVVVVLVLTVLGAMTLTILERVREIGTWRALGFGRGQVTGLMVREALLLSIVGLLLGLGAGLGCALLINNSGVRFSPPGVPGSIALLIKPAAWACAIQAAMVIPGVCLAAWVVVRTQLKRNLVDLLTAQAG